MLDVSEQEELHVFERLEVWNLFLHDKGIVVLPWLREIQMVEDKKGKCLVDPSQLSCMIGPPLSYAIQTTPWLSDTRRSNIGSIKLLGDRLWSCHLKAEKHAISSTKAEIYLLCGCCAKSFGLRIQFLTDYGFDSIKIHVTCDDKALLPYAAQRSNIPDPRI
ncbi:hypothetical protein Tco_0215260 [Tanacetum coccineum]